MPLTADSVIQENTGSGTSAGTSISVSVPSGTAAGNTVLVFLSINSAAPTATGFVLDKQVGTNPAAFVFRKSDTSAAETSWTFTVAAGVPYEWYATEVSGMDLVGPLDSSAISGGAPTSVANGGTLSTGTAPLNSGLNTVQFAVFGATQAASSTESWSGYTGGFVEVADLAANVSGGLTLAVARNFGTSTGAFSVTATLATSQASTGCFALIVAYRAVDSPIVTPLAHFLGFDWLTHGGIHSHTGATNMLGSTLTSAAGTVGTNMLIQAGSARNSAGGLRITTTATAAYVYTGTLATKILIWGANVRVVSATGTVVVAEFYVGTVAAQLLYDASATKFGVRAGSTGTPSWESGTTATNTWRWVDLRVRTDSATYSVDWRIETAASIYTDQASASLGGQSPLNLAMVRLGSATSQTMTADYDDVLFCNYYSAYPLGPHEVKLLTVDPAGTPTLSGTSTNFSVFTANGTLGAWNATNARNAVDEVPPTISASADGVTQTAVAASDYMEFPMSTYTLAANETVVGVRMLAPLWSGTGSGSGDLAIRGWDGTTETALATASQILPGSATTATATVPIWRCAMWQSVNGWTQAELDAAALRVGFSGDATPDMGVHAAYLEIAVGKTRTQQVVGDPAGASMTAEYDPNRAGMVSSTATAAADQGETLSWTDSGGSGSQAVAAGGTFTHQSNATAPDEVSAIGLESAPEFEERE